MKAVRHQAALPPIAALLHAMRSGAPRRPTLAGAAAGVGGGVIGAAVFALYCPKDSVLFVAIWYGLGLAIAGALGPTVEKGGGCVVAPVTEPLRRVRACVFDAYGTLFDFASAAARCRDDLGPAADRLTALWRDKQLQYTWLRAVQGRHADFWQVTGDALDFALETLGIADRPLREKLMALYLSLDAFPEVPAMLAKLKAAGVRTAILSNGSPRMLEAIIDHAGIRGGLDHVMSVEEVGVFKPDPKVYGLAVERLGLVPDEISFQSSNAWDAYAASAFGMRVVWCNRYGQKPERMPGAPDREIRDLAELPALVGAA